MDGGRNAENGSNGGPAPCEPIPRIKVKEAEEHASNSSWYTLNSNYLNGTYM